MFRIFSGRNILAIALAVTCFEAASGVAAAAKCLPLVVLYGGGWDAKTEIMKRVAKDLKKNWGRDAIVEYYAHDQGNVSHSSIQRHLRACSRSLIALIGHSWGGATAYSVAKDWGDRITLLVTLDAVGGGPYSRSKPYNVRKWINVHKKYGLWQAFFCGLTNILSGWLWDRNDCLALTGGPWMGQKNASNYLFAGDHADASGMYEMVSRSIEEDIINGSP